MATITRFTLQQSQKNLLVEFDHDSTMSFSFEYLRVFSPAAQSNTGEQKLVSHKKLVMIRKIEAVAKKSYRLLFDDNHSAIFTANDFITLYREYEMRWQHYLNLLQQSPHSREAMLDIKQL